MSLAPLASAAPVGSGMITTNIPTTIDGLKINLVSGETDTTGSSVDGWDANIFGYSMIFASPSRARKAGFTTRLNRERGVNNLPLGSEVGPSVGFESNLGPTLEEEFQYTWMFPGDANYVGTRFLNETTG